MSTISLILSKISRNLRFDLNIATTPAFSLNILENSGLITTFMTGQDKLVFALASQPRLL